jgi:hypothetical protein
MLKIMPQKRVIYIFQMLLLIFLTFLEADGSLYHVYENHYNYKRLGIGKAPPGLQFQVDLKKNIS